VRTLWYRTDYLKEAGYDAPPATWEELREVAKATTVTEGDKITRAGFHFQPASTNWQNDFQLFIALLAAAGGKFLSDDNTKVLLTEGPAIETASFMRALVFDDKTTPYPPFENQGDLGALHTDQAAMTNGNEGLEITAKLNAPEKLPLLQAALPAANKEQKTHVWINKFFISKLSPRPDDSWKLLEHMTSKEHLETYTASFNTIPPRKSLSEAAFFTENMKVLAKSAENANTYPKYHRMAELFRPTATALEEILRGQKDVETAMGEAAAAIDKILAEG
jgi:multiple sugar transport system substrate-binding protein